MHKKLPWVNAYPLAELAINAEGLSSPPFADGTFPVHVGFHTYAGPHWVRTRRHEYLEVTYIYAGRADIQVQDRSFAVTRGDLIVLASNLYHRILNKPNREVKIVSLNFRPELIRGSEPGPDAELYLLPFVCQDPAFPHVISASRRLAKRVLTLILDIHRDLPSPTELDQLAVKTRIKMLLLVLLEHYKVYLRRNTILHRREHDIRRLRPLFHFIEQKYSQPIEVADAARLCAMSSSHFMRFFKTVTAESFLAYLNNFRIAKAQTLLATTEEAIGDISAEVAFCSQSYFGKVFLERVGMTPLAYRRRFGWRPDRGRLKTL